MVETEEVCVVGNTLDVGLLVPGAGLEPLGTEESLCCPLVELSGVFTVTVVEW